MKIVFRILLFAALAALGIWLWTVLFPSPEKVIRKRLMELARTVSSSSNESDLTRLAAARSVAGFFSTNVELNVELPELRPAQLHGSRRNHPGGPVGPF